MISHTTSSFRTGGNLLMLYSSSISIEGVKAELKDGDLELTIPNGPDTISLIQSDVGFEFGFENIMIVAAGKGQQDVCEFLINNQRVDTNYKNETGFTALHASAAKGHLELSKMLIDNGDTDVTNSQEEVRGNAPLHCAAREGHAEVCQMLIDHGANVNVETKSGTTPLHYAAISNRLDVCKVLIKNGANINASIEGSDGTPFALARFQGHTELSDWLAKHGAE